MIKTLIKSILKYLFPDFYLELMSHRARADSQRKERKYGCTNITHQLIDRHGAIVQSGPFVGLQFPPSTHDRHLAHKLVGSYECELHETFNKIVKEDYQEILDIGCADGYYAVGLAQHFPNCTVHAFDTDHWARRVTEESSQLNNVDNLSVHGKCNPDWLADYLKPNTFILSDCEGYEDHLFRPSLAPTLLQCDLLIELHEDASPGVTERLVERFQDSHSASVISTRPRHPERYNQLSFLPKEDRELAVNELRAGQQSWLFLERNA